jgi:FKBP-type peptidyl-prolyl cis-trans isomerase
MRTRALIPMAAALAALIVASCGYPDPNTGSGPVAGASETTPTPLAGGDQFNEGAGKATVKFPDGLQTLDLKIGDGQMVPAGATVDVQYTGWLSNGTQFDTSRQPGRDVLCAILVNTQQTNGDCTPVIPGWNEGVPGMKVGGRRKLIIPPSLAYGEQGAPPTIPANATLTFTVELVSIVTTATPPPAKPAPSPS